MNRRLNGVNGLLSPVKDRPQVEESPNGASFRRKANKRPNLDLFLREIFETYVFTAAMEVS